jgi:hypothetical protein
MQSIQRRNSCSALAEDTSRVSLSSSLFVGKITINVKGTTANKNAAPTSHATCLPTHHEVNARIEPAIANDACPFESTLANYFQRFSRLQVDVQLVLRRPIETTALIRHSPINPAFGGFQRLFVIAAHFANVIMLTWFRYPMSQLKTHSDEFSRFKQLPLSG